MSWRTWSRLTASDFDVAEWRQKCYDAMNDDFNSPILIAQLFEAVKQINIIKDGKAKINAEDLELLKKTMSDFIFDVLGLVDTAEAADNDFGNKLSGTVELLIKLRAEARGTRILPPAIRSGMNFKSWEFS